MLVQVSELQLEDWLVIAMQRARGYGITSLTASYVTGTGEPI